MEGQEQVLSLGMVIRQEMITNTQVQQNYKLSAVSQIPERKLRQTNGIFNQHSVKLLEVKFFIRSK